VLTTPPRRFGSAAALGAVYRERSLDPLSVRLREPGGQFWWHASTALNVQARTEHSPRNLTIAALTTSGWVIGPM